MERRSYQLYICVVEGVSFYTMVSLKQAPWALVQLITVLIHGMNHKWYWWANMATLVRTANWSISREVKIWVKNKQRDSKSATREELCVFLQRLSSREFLKPYKHRTSPVLTVSSVTLILEMETARQIMVGSPKANNRVVVIPWSDDLYLLSFTKEIFRAVCKVEGG